MNGLYPATIESYDAASKTCKVTMDGVTSGTSGLLTAEIGYPIGDKSPHTDIKIFGGELVWIMFEAGDMRHPIITHFRNKRTGNEMDWRKFHHDNIGMSADDTLIIKAKSIVFESDSFTHNSVNVGSTHVHSQKDGNHFGGDIDTSTPH